MTKRPLPRYDLQAVLAALGACRTAMIALRAGSPARSLPRAAADLLTVRVALYDHLIIGAAGETSLAAEGLID